MISAAQIRADLEARKCSIIEDRGDFVLVFPYGYNGRERTHELAAKTQPAAFVEAWNWLHPEKEIAECIDIVMRTVAHDFKISPEAMLMRDRSEPLATARRLAMALCRQVTPASLVAIGAAFGGRDHASVLYAADTIKDEASGDPQLAARLSTLARACTAAFVQAAKGER